MSQEPLQRLLGIVVGALTLLLLFLSRAACHQRGHGTPTGTGGGTGGACVVFWGKARWESVTMTYLLPGSNLSPSSAPPFSGGHSGAL